MPLGVRTPKRYGSASVVVIWVQRWEKPEAEAKWRQHSPLEEQAEFLLALIAEALIAEQPHLTLGRGPRQ